MGRGVRSFLAGTEEAAGVKVEEAAGKPTCSNAPFRRTNVRISSSSGEWDLNNRDGLDGDRQGEGGHP